MAKEAPLCSRCGHKIADHFPNFALGVPVSFYCRHCEPAFTGCVRTADAIKFRRDKTGRIVAVSEQVLA